jgi:hypothetical protein
MARLEIFSDVPVVPVTLVHRHIAFGGPIWPDFDHQTWVRHCRNNKPMDRAPERPEEVERLEGDAVWGGFLDSHFGHFVSDHLARLPAVLRERPGDTYLFTVDPGVTLDTLPAWVAQVFDWIGLPMHQVRLVTAPLLVRRLWVGNQAEMLPNAAPEPGYLEIIAPWAKRLVATPSRLLYVARVGMAAQGGGCHAGEGYLTELLQKRGVAVLDPATAPLEQQLAAYAGAKRIVFAEGSALHGRQLLGRLNQDIVVLRRRPGTRMAAANLTPRCRKLIYHDVGKHILMSYWKTGPVRRSTALNLYDVGRMQKVIAWQGIDLRADWDRDAYAQAAMADVERWIAWHQPKEKRLEEYAAILSRAGLGPEASALAPSKLAQTKGSV